jgi:hypothetical protein
MRNPVTFYNDCDSLCTQAEKDFTETATNKAKADPISLIVEETRDARL